MKISALKYNTDSIAITVDGEKLILRVTSANMKLRSGQDLDDDAVAEFRTQSDIYGAYLKSLKYLAVRHTGEELRRYLARKGFSPEASLDALNSMKEKGYIDDYQYALSFIADKKRMKKVGRNFLFSALLKKGVDQGIIKDAISGYEGEIESVDEALSAARKKIRGNYDREKIARFLFSRGFSGDTVFKALKVLSEEYRDLNNYNHDGELE